MENKEISGAELAPLFRLSRDAVCGIADGRIVFCNEAACRLFGRDVNGETAADCFPGLDEELWAEGVATSLTVNGAVRDVTTASFHGVLVLTVQREEPPRKPVPAAALRQMRSATLHFRLSLDRLMAEREPEERYGCVLFHNHFLLRHIAEQFSDLNAVSDGTMTCRLQPLDLSRLVRELVDSVAFFARQRGIAFRCDVPEDRVTVLGEYEKVEQMLLILLSSSIQRTGRGGTITVRLQKQGRVCRLSVVDDGCALTDGELAEAFSPHAEDTLAEAPGTGLGFAIAQGLARAHGGMLVVQSRRDAGTGMYLQFPTSSALVLRDAEARDRGAELLLTELSEVLPNEAYQKKYRE